MGMVTKMGQISDDFILAIFSAVGAIAATQTFTLDIIATSSELSIAQAQILKQAIAKSEAAQGTLAVAMEVEMARIANMG